MMERDEARQDEVSRAGSTSMWIGAFHAPLRWSVTGLVLVGAAFAATSAILSFARVGARDGVTFTLVAAMLGVVAVGVARGLRWVVAVVIVVCAGQIGAVVGTALELMYGVAPSKAAQLRKLGFDPAVGVSINLVYSAAAFGLFCWLLGRRARLRRDRSRAV